MPSGSHGGSRGSHRSGGSRGGGSSFRSGGSSSGGSRQARPIIFRFGRTRYVIAPRWASIISLLGFFIFFSAISLIGCVYSLNEAKDYIRLIETDYHYYNQMIAKGENFEDYRRIGKITDHFYNDDCGKWYFTYEIDLEDMYGNVIDDLHLDGYTYSIFTFEEINKYPIGTDIQIAINTTTVKRTTDSIPILCKDYPIEADGEYIQAVQSYNMTIFGVCGFAVVTAGLIGGVIWIMVKKNEKQEINSDGTVLVVKHERKCEYCGGVVGDGELHCKSCGARVKYKENEKTKG